MKQQISAFFEELRKLSVCTDRIYIYGAGLFGRNLYHLIQQKGIAIAGFLVTKKAGEKETKGIPILEAEEVLKDNIGIIIGVNRRNEVEVRRFLQEQSFDMDKVINGNGLMDNDGGRAGYDSSPVIEVTTKMGCKVNCKYCPQSVLIKKYFEKNPRRTDIMDYELFQSCIQKTPEDTLVRFCGMSEPFLNSDCIKMMQYTCSLGRRVDLFTTLVGLETKDLEILVKLPIEWVNLHVADRYGYADIPLTEEYLKQLSILASAEKADGTPFINVISAQSEPHARVLEICRDKFVIYSTLTDRAGNLDADELIRKETEGKISCSLCGQKLNHNILLPDGTLLLCCMDYGMRHVLGNLKEQSYEEIMSGAGVQNIREGMLSDFSKAILCRTCSYASPVC